MIKKLEETSEYEYCDGLPIRNTARRLPPTNLEMMEKINEIIEKLNKQENHD